MERSNATPYEHERQIFLDNGVIIELDEEPVVKTPESNQAVEEAIKIEASANNDKPKKGANNG